MYDARKSALAAKYESDLLSDTIPFWLRHAVDTQHGGYATAINRDGQIIDTDKSVWHQGRFAWMLGELYNNVEPRAEWLEAARHGIDFLDSHCFDPTDGRMWFQVTADGRPLRKRRYSFSEAFAAIAYGEFAKATGEAQYATKAAHCFRKFIEHSATSSGKFTGERPTKGIGVPMITIGTAQELRESIGLSEANELIDESIRVIQRDHMHPELEAVLETVGINGEFVDHFDGRLLNPGHAFEAAWFILKEARHRGDDPKLVDAGTQILRWMWNWGWDEEFGGIYYFRDVKQYPPQEYWHDMKFWWPQNEAIIATLYAYILTADELYSQWHQLVHDWAHSHFADAQDGEWYGYLHRDGRISHHAKGNLWKGPFHLPRMQLICWQLLTS